jgi:hypothetical protein
MSYKRRRGYSTAPLQYISLRLDQVRQCGSSPNQQGATRRASPWVAYIPFPFFFMNRLYWSQISIDLIAWPFSLFPIHVASIVSEESSFGAPNFILACEYPGISFTFVRTLGPVALPSFLVRLISLLGPLALALPLRS